MKKIKKLSVVIVALAVCLLFGSVVWAESGTAGTNVFAATISDSTLCVSDQEQTVTVTIAAPQAITLYGVQGTVGITTQSAAALTYSIECFNETAGEYDENGPKENETDTVYNEPGAIFVWFDEPVAGESVQTLVTIKVTIPANTTGTYLIGLSNLEYVKGLTEADVVTASDIVTVLTISEHDWGEPSYENNGDGTHTATYTCTADATHTKSDAPATHTYTLEGGTKCVCGATKPTEPATGLKGDVNGDNLVNSGDLTVLARHVGGIEPITNEVALVNADVNGDGEINSADLTKHARYVGGIITDWSQN